MEKKHPRIKSHFSIIAHNKNLIELRSGVWNQITFTLEDDEDTGNLYQFISRLDGTKSISEIVKEINISRSDAEGIIDHLEKLDAIEDNSSTALDYFLDLYSPAFKNNKRDENEIVNQKIFIISNSDLGVKIKERLQKNTPLQNIEILSSTCEILNTLNNPDESWLQNELEFNETITKHSDLQGSFFILASNTINPVLTKKFNRLAATLNIQWINASIDGPFIFIGPTFNPPSSACYECFETRVSINLREFNSYQKYKNALVNNLIIRQSEFPMNNILQDILISHLSLEVLNFICTGSNFTKNKTLSIYLPTMEITFNDFIKLSDCPNCGSQLHKDDHQLYFDLQKLLKEIA
jgi:thiazole/oxazole-forming peptide maturase SagC family component